MLNFNGTLFEKDSFSIPISNRGFTFGDALTDTIKVKQGTVVFLEAHYFRLMASMRIFRMKIPIQFTLEFLESQILETVSANQLTEAIITLTVFRAGQEAHLIPETNQIQFMITIKPCEVVIKSEYEVALYKDFSVNQDMLSNLNFIGQPLEILAGIYIKDYGYDNALLINNAKNVVQAIDANMFLVQGEKIITPPLSDGCKNGIIRKKIIEILKKDVHLKLEERAVSPFEIQKSDELFLTNSIFEVQAVTKYRIKEFKTEVSQNLLQQLKTLI